MKQHIVFVLDKSGSMEEIRDRVISGFNEFLEDQKREAKHRGDDVRLTLTLFDSPVYSNVLGQVGFVNAYVNENVEDVPGLTKETYVPGGATALLDAVGRTLEQVGECDGAEQVLMVVMTDGEENSSEKVTKVDLKAQIDERQQAGWAVVYMGANVDEFAEAGSMGIASHTTRGWEATDDGADVAMADLSRATTRYLACESSVADFWEEPAESGSSS